jgi:hypothetical protein
MAQNIKKLESSLLFMIVVLLLWPSQVYSLDYYSAATDPPANRVWNSFSSDEFEDIDEYAINAPDSVKGSIKSLASYLTKPAKNDREKARAIFRWIAENINYDVEGLFKGIPEDTTPEGVLKSGRSVCGGYSNLFESLANASGLETITISGYSKGYNYTPGVKFDGPTNHAWNAIKLDGQWQLIDSTWGAGYLKNGKYVREFDDHYFLTPPEEFIYDHFPEDQRWQLLDKPLSKKEFENLVYLKSAFFNLGLKLANQNNTISSNGRANVTLFAPNDVYVIAKLKSLNESPTSDKVYGSPMLIRRDKEQYIIELLPPSPGDYILSVFGKSGSEEGSYEEILEYKVEESSGSKMSFPIVFSKFFNLGMRLNNLTNGTIEARGRAYLSLYAPPDVLIMSRLEKLDKDLNPSRRYGEPTLVKRSGDHYNISILPPSSGDYVLEIYAKRKDEGNSYHEVVAYNVTAPFGSNMSYPTVFNGFFDLGLHLSNDTNGTIEAAGKANLSIPAPSNILMMATLKKLDKSGNPFVEEKSSIFLQYSRTANYYDIEILPPTPGEYVLTVFAKQKGNPNNYQGILQYNISASSGSDIVFPEVLGDFQEKGVYLYSPMTGNLKAGLNYTFNLTIPGAERAAVISGKDWHQLTKNDDLFQGEVVTGKGEIDVGASYSGTDKYSILLRYRGV